MVPRGERRRLTRISTTIEAELALAGRPPLRARVVNLSGVGLRANAPEPLPLGARVSVVLSTGGDRVELGAKVVRCEGGVLALGFERVPYESYERLRTFLLRHAGDPAVIAEELADRLGFLGESA
jgi:hypothetical protein